MTDMFVKPNLHRPNNDENPAAVYLASKAKNSRRIYRAALRHMASLLTAGAIDDPLFIPWEQLRVQHTAALRVHLAEQLAPATANFRLTALRGVLRVAWQLGIMSADDYQRAIDLPPVRGERLASGRHVSQAELTALLATCEPSKLGARDAAIITMLYGCGLRRAELCQLQLGDYDPAAGLIVVNGKGKKQREIYLQKNVGRALAGWLARRGHDAGPLFVSLGGRQRGGQLVTQAIYDILQKRAALAKIAAVSPHDFRHTFAGNLLGAGVDIVTVSQLMGHSSVEVTASYDRRDNEAKRRAVDLLQVPYEGQG